MSYRPNTSIHLERRTVSAGSHAHVFRTHKGGAAHPHITTGKPFDQEAKAWCIVETHHLSDTQAIRTVTAFRNKAHADAWLGILAGV